MRDINLCHPRLQRIANVWIKACAAEGITVAISETLRTAAEQDALYAQGRTKPGSIVTNAKGSSYRSQHQWGIAFDFYLRMDIDGDGKISDDAYNDSQGHFRRAAEIGKKLGLAWGGDWQNIVDKPHLYLPNWGSTPSQLIQQYGTPEKFMATWVPDEIKTGWQQEGGGWRFYYRDGSGKYVSNAWYKDGDKWYWFDGAGVMVRDTWYSHNGSWYYLGADGAMVKGLQTIGGKWYYLDDDGRMATEPVVLTPDQDGALQYPGLASKYYVCYYNMKKRTGETCCISCCIFLKNSVFRGKMITF